MDDCVFCKIVAGEISSDKVFENEDFIVIRDVNPKVEGHLLVVSKEHYGSFLEMNSKLDAGLLKSVRDVVVRLGLRDFNLVVNNGLVAGQIVGHFHLHILPRSEGDGLKLGC